MDEAKLWIAETTPDTSSLERWSKKLGKKRMQKLLTRALAKAAEREALIKDYTESRTIRPEDGRTPEEARELAGASED